LVLQRRPALFSSNRAAHGGVGQATRSASSSSPRARSHRSSLTTAT